MTFARVATAAALLCAVDGARVSARKSGARSSCGSKGLSAMSNESHMQIVNGETATECEWKWQAGLKYGNMPFCGGMLISEDWVLTAAHCASSPTFDVVLGEYKPGVSSGYEQVRAAVEVIRHPGYNSNTFEWDLCMVRLASPVQMTNCVGTVCLPEGDDVKPGSTCWISGWGTLSSGGSQPDVLQEAEVTIISNADCVNKYEYTASQIDGTMICAQGKTADGEISDACQGDSGGPLVCQSAGVWTLYGATSWGNGCAGATYPGIWARVHEGMPWIEGILTGNPVPTPAPAPSACPSATSSGPDSNGDCRCNSGLYCYLNGASGCPFSYTANYGWTSTGRFSTTCGDACVCK